MHRITYFARTSTIALSIFCFAASATDVQAAGPDATDPDIVSECRFIKNLISTSNIRAAIHLQKSGMRIDSKAVFIGLYANDPSYRKMVDKRFYCRRADIIFDIPDDFYSISIEDSNTLASNLKSKHGGQ